MTDLHPDYPESEEEWKEAQVNLEVKPIELLKDIEKYKFNWECVCKNCIVIKMKILQYNHENKDEKKIIEILTEGANEE